MSARLILAVLGVATGGCEAPPSGPPGAEWVGAIDTLASGVVRVSNPAPASIAPPLRLETALRIGGEGAGGEPTFGRVPDLVSDGEGGVWVLDAASGEVIHFDSRGAETVRFGGHFLSPRRLHRAGDTLWVEDLGSMDWSAWTREGQPIGVVALPTELTGGEASWTTDGLVGVVERRDDDGSRVRWAGRWRVSGEVFARVDSFAPPSVPEPLALQTTVLRQGREVGLAFPLPLAHQPQVMPHPDGTRWVITPGGGDYRFQLADLGGGLRREVTREVEPVTLSESEREAAVARLPAELREAQAERVPTTYPPFDRIVVADDDAYWLVRSNGLAETAFDLFDPEGRYRGTVRGGPELAGFWLHAADPRGVWGVRRDEAGRPEILRLEWAGD